jgi:protein-tyrosine kinase
MSRVYRALQKAEREREEKPKEEPRVEMIREGVVPRREELVQKRAEETVERMVCPVEELSPISAASSGSFAWEQFRKLKTQIFHWKSDPPRIILVTSTVPSEGKTTVAFNLALAISQEINRKAILIDGDLRKPGIHLKDHHNPKGLTNYLSNQIPLAEILIRYEDNFWIIPAGPSSGKSSELIGTKKTREFLSCLREFGEDTFVIIDSPPILATSDPMLLSKIVDGIVMVVMADRTPRETVRRAIQSVDRDKIIGVVLNQMDMKPIGHYAKYYSGYSR